MTSVGYKGAQPYEERDPGALDEHEGAPSSVPPPPNVERPSNAYVESVRGFNADAADVEHMMEEFAEKEYTDVAKLNISAFPSVKWAESWSCGFGGVRVICVGAWVVFLLFPVLFYFLVRGRVGGDRLDAADLSRPVCLHPCAAYLTTRARRLRLSHCRLRLLDGASAAACGSRALA